MAASDARSYPMAAEAAAEIVSQKLEILLSDPACVGCLLIKTHVKDTKAKLAVIQELLFTQYRQSETTEWWRRLLRAMYCAEELIDKFHFRQARERYKALHVATRPLTALVSKFMLWRDLSYLVNDMDKLCQDKFLTGKNEEAERERKKEPARSSSRDSVPWQDTKLGRLTIFRDPQAWRNNLYRGAEEKEIMERIANSTDLGGVQAISILGEQGVGKTFLTRWVYRKARGVEYLQRYHVHFNLVAWVHVSTCVDQREFLLEILKQVENLPTEVKDMNFYEITKMLCQKLTKTNRFLIVLDDVHPSDEQLLQGLVMIIPPCSRGHIITTTQDARIALIMNSCGPGPIKLTNLNDEESQKMLSMKFDGVRHVRSLSQEENNMLKSPGLPLCISLLNGLLSNAKGSERTALLKDWSMTTLLDILQLSYDRLPVHLKPCFIYMALFPKASTIPTRRLVRLWLAEGLLDAHCYDGERKRTMPPEEVGETFILELAHRNVINVVSWTADGFPKACQMLTSLYDMIRAIAMSTGFIYIHAAIRNPIGQNQRLPVRLLERTKVRWLAEHTNIVTDSRGGSFPDLYLGHVRSFLSFYMRRGILTEDISTFLSNMTSKTAYSMLRVLDLEGVYKPSLQGVLHKLVLLRYLGLRRTVLDSLPSTVADLHYLETLDIKHTNITSLPGSFWKARNLRHLHLNWFYINMKNILKAGSNNVKGLTKLQTLSGLVIGEVKENLMTGHMDSLTTLTKLKLFMQQSDGNTSGAAWVTVADWISFRLTNLQSLTLGVIKKAKPTKEDKSKKEARPATSPIGPLPELSLKEHQPKLFKLYLLGQLKTPNWTNLLPGSLGELTLSGSEVEIDMMPELGGLLKNLRTFGLLANSFLGTALRFLQDGFPMLMILKIWKLPRLQQVIIEAGAMPHLKELEFRHLKRLETVEGLNNCMKLEHISLVPLSKALLNQLEHGLGKHGLGKHTILIIEKDTKRPGSTDNNEDDSSDDDKASASP